MFKSILCNSFLSLHLLQDLHPVWPTNQTNSCPWHHLVDHHYILYSCSLFNFEQNWPSPPWSFSFLLIFVAFKQYEFVRNVSIEEKTLPRFSHGPINIKKAKQALATWSSHSSHKCRLQNRLNIYVYWKAIHFVYWKAIHFSDKFIELLVAAAKESQWPTLQVCIDTSQNSWWNYLSNMP